MGLKTQNHNMKYKYYRYAVLVMLVSCKLIHPLLSRSTYFSFPILRLIPVASVLTALILYPVCFAAKLNSGKYFYRFYSMCLPPLVTFYVTWIPIFIEYLNLRRGRKFDLKSHILKGNFHLLFNGN